MYAARRLTRPRGAGADVRRPVSWAVWLWRVRDRGLRRALAVLPTSSATCAWNSQAFPQYRSWLRFRNSFVFTTRPPRDAAPSCRSCPSHPQGRRHMCQCARSAGSRWVPQCERALQLQCSLALRRCATAAKHVWTSRTVLLRCSRLAARSRPTTTRTPEAAGVASLMTCATRRRGQLRFHNAPHFWHPPASRA